MSPKLRRVVLIVLVVLLGAFIAISTQDKSAKKEMPPLTPDTSALEKPVPAIGVVLSPVTFNETVQAAGVLEGWNRSLISADAGGRLVGWEQPIGRMLDSGAVICRFDDELPRLQFEQAQAALAAAQVNAEKAQRDWERVRELFETGSASKGEAEAAELNRKASQANLASAKAAAGLARRAWEHTALTMPYRGVLGRRMAEVGQTVPPGVPVAEVVQMQPLRLTLALPANEVGRVQRGQAVLGMVGTNSHNGFVGSIHAVGAAADALTRLFPVEVLVGNTDNSLKPGYSAEVEIVIKEHQDAIVVPNRSVLKSEQGERCFVLKDGRADAASIETAYQSKTAKMVLKGLSPGDTLLTVGVEALKDRQRVSVTLQSQ